MSERHVKLCDAAAPLWREWEAMTPNQAVNATFDSSFNLIDDYIAAHPPELLLALWECPRYGTHNGECLVPGCPGKPHALPQPRPHADDCPVRRVEELSRE